MASSTGLPSLTFSPSGFRGLRGSSSSSSDGFGFGSGSKSSDGFGFKPFKPSKPKQPKGMTVNQALYAAFLAKQAHPHHSLLGRVLHGATHTVETGLDYLARPSYAIAAGTYDATKNHGFNVGQFLHGASQGIQGKDKKGFGQVLSEHHILQHHGFLRGLAGLGLDVASDPLTYVTMGGDSAAVVAAKEAEMGLAKGTLKAAIHGAQHGTFTDAKQAMEASNLLRKAGLHATAELSKVHLQLSKLKAAGQLDTVSHKMITSQLHGLQAVSHIDVAQLGARHIRVGFKPPFLKGVSVATKMHAPSMVRVADKQGILGKLPGLPNAVETVGKAFKPGWRNEKMHALEIMSKHVAELRQNLMAHIVQDTLVPATKGLSEADMLKALKWGENTPGIVTVRAGRAERNLSLRALQAGVKEGHISEAQAEFVKAWHATTEALRKADAEYGVKYDSPLLKGAEKNILYVPHIREAASGLKVGREGSMLAKKGFQFERAPQSQIALMEHLAATHPDVGITTHPLEIMARRAMSGANKQAEQFMVDTVARTFGVPTRMPNVEQLLKLNEKWKNYDAMLAKMKTITPKGLADEHLRLAAENEAQRLGSLAKAAENHGAKEVALKKSLATARGQATRYKNRKVPTARQFLGMKNADFAKYAGALKKAKAPFHKAVLGARAQHKALDALERQVEASLRKGVTTLPKTGSTAHGREYRALVEDLLNKAQGAFPRTKVPTFNEAGVRTGTAVQDEAARLKDAYLGPVKPRDSWQRRHERLVDELGSSIKKARQDNIANLEKALSGHETRRANPTATVKALESALAKHQASWGQIEAKINSRAANRLQVAKSSLDELQHKELTRAQAIGRAMDRVEAKVHYHSSSKANPAANGLTTVDRLKAANGKPIALPPEMAAAMERSRRALQSDEFLQQFHNTAQKLIAKWKVGVTVVNPGYRVRNTLSDLWNAYISGVPVWAMARYGEKAARLIQTVRHLPSDPATWTKEQKQASLIFTEMYHHGVLAGLFQGDIEKVRRFLEGTGSAKDLITRGHPLQALTKTATDFNRHAENWGRMMHYLYRREGQKLSAGEAAHIVRGAHFDYEDLTPAEQSIKRNGIPFYTWTRKNIPYQIQAMAQRPGKYAAFPLMANEMNQASPKVPGEIVPSWIKQGLGFHVPFGGKGNFYLPVFGPVDLEKLQHPVSQGSSMLSPLLQVPAELMMNKNLNTGAPIYGSANTHPRNPISGFAASILGNIPGTDVGQTSRTVNGKKMTGPGANPLVTYFAQQTPLSNFIVNAESNIKKAQRGGGNKAALSEFGGISTYKPDQAAQQSVAKFNAQQAYKQFIRGLRDEGRIPEPKKRKVSAATAANNRSATIAFGGK